MVRSIRTVCAWNTHSASVFATFRERGVLLVFVVSWARETSKTGVGMGSKIVVGIPAYNEERAIAGVVARALPHAAEVVVVDDGSADQTALRALKAGAVVIRHSMNSGKGAAVVALFQYAIDHMADVLVLIDGDGQHDPDEIPTVVAP